MKGAQEAHEAIRPTARLREPDAIKRFLRDDQFRLYNLIWQRIVASQMADALFDVTTVDIEATARAGRPVPPARDEHTAQVPRLPPGLRGRQGRGRRGRGVGNNPLPPLAQSDALNLLQVLPDQHFTEPPHATPRQAS